MGRMYSVVMDAQAIAIATSFMRLTAAATDSLKLHSVVVTQDSSEVSEQLPFEIYRASTAGTGDATTPEKLGGVSDAAFNGTCVTNLTGSVPTKTGIALHRESINVLNGFYWRPTPNEMIVVPPSGIIVVHLDAAPAASLTWSMTVVFEETS